ncbi:hypothetical protein A3H38_03630 [candidate division WOR-1 bacterium RIFCSPLOWO2_02_FULL_46_20]|uniref:Type II secretion system protein GspI C-terminal domain-containing protein n=2 Tax=Saganbacteria TaxID=1703751 RepID=A0A1F4R4U0_UNCSA|nr:MAG: hypothetical protein A3J44_00480 [candidate division WOR-1 bacterium RIFCSPHIGHO2_02_FULL_45_12]OGC03116.1 MAG: hypothetical protein A3H38_03630 [candidate division WOR-1 bacterium RIFCSPLOWO2_02_FULL_46_20]OGC08059.1 MAG: hypothetical protein A3F86_01615 [candidate division WOR-1 bacterium RIFCSPLOWO2_12_FULL_45_9]
MNKKGFTLIEVMVVAALFLLTTAGFNYLLILSSASVEKATLLCQATYLLQSKMEEIKLLPFASLPDLNGNTFAAGNGTIKVSPVLADLINIELSLPPHKLQTLRSKY